MKKLLSLLTLLAGSVAAVAAPAGGLLLTNNPAGQTNVVRLMVQDAIIGGLGLTNIPQQKIVSVVSNSVYDVSEAYLTGIGTINDAIGSVNASSANGHYTTKTASPRVLTNSAGVYLFWSVGDSVWYVYTNMTVVDRVWLYPQSSELYSATNGTLLDNSPQWSDGGGSTYNNIGAFKTNTVAVTSSNTLVTTSMLNTFSNRLDFATLKIAESWKFQHYNRRGLTNSLAKVRAGQTLRVMIAGQGLAEYFQSYLFRSIESNFTWVGSGPAILDINPSVYATPYHTLSLALTGGAGYTNSTALCENSHIVLAASGHTATVVGDGFQLGNKFEMDYIGQPGGGTFKIQTNNAGTWTDLSGATAVSTSTSAGVTNLQRVQWTAPGNVPYNIDSGIRCVWVSGTAAHVLGAVVEDTTRAGYMQFQYRKQGSGFADFLSGGPGVYTNIVKFWAPDLIVVCMLANDYTQEALYFKTIRDYFPNVDVVGMTRRQNGPGLDSPALVATENLVIRDCMRTNGWSCFDEHGVAFQGDTNLIVAQWPSAIGIHPGTDYWNDIARVLWGWMDL